MNKVELEVLSLATEDWYGLWQRTSLLEDTSAFRAAIEKLMERGWIYLCNYKSRENTCEPMSHRLVTAALADSATWEHPSDVRYGATSAGKEAYFGSRRPS